MIKASTAHPTLYLDSSSGTKDQYELPKSYLNMPVGSLRRHRPSQPHPTTNENENNVESDQLSLRNKRNRAASLHDQEELHKRRRLANNAHPQKLRIPLRNRTGLQQQKSDAFPHGAGELPTPATSVGSPTPKAQYDQFRRVEEKARAAITQQKTDEDDRRKLRSEHGGSRSKTELAQYFPNFEDMLSLEPPDPGMPILYLLSVSMAEEKHIS